MPNIKSLCVFCASSAFVEEKYRNLGVEMGEICAKNGWRLIYGGARGGIMGAMADAALASGGEVEGIIPEILGPQERAHAGLTRLHIVPDMHTRQKKMADLADGFVVLPGGIGTLAEFFEIITWKSIGLHQKPVVIINTYGFWDDLLQMIEKCGRERFMHKESAQMYDVLPTPEAAQNFFKSKT
ncbi:MAG: TIGR00730 family Rossman fold protein [Alphaproteobacteria bacterium]|nr:TIGR00730 family Rossman fold protein [Alphaproteobacteria bacterium]